MIVLSQLSRVITMKCKFIKHPPHENPCYELELECEEEFIKDFDRMYYGKLDVRPSNFGYIIHGDKSKGFITLKIIVQEEKS